MRQTLKKMIFVFPYIKPPSLTPSAAYRVCGNISLACHLQNLTTRYHKKFSDYLYADKVFS